MADGTTLGNAYIQIIPSMEGTASRISSMLNSEGISAGEEAGKETGSSFMSTLKSTIASLATTLAIGATIKKSFDLGADLEQQLGGVDTLFKDNADTIKNYANEAYKSCGLSANAYMSNVTSFSSSLLQGLDNDTAKAAEYANTAMVDMADNANKFGTDISSIQNAYQGFAKQNYTMLDNLKLGYGGTKTEMQRLIAHAATLTDTVDAESLSFDNIVLAIHAVQDEMGVLGTTEEEASTTFSGSLGAMSSAWDNFLAGLMMSGKDGIDVETYIQPLIDSASTFVFENLIPAVGRMVLAVIEAIPGLIDSALSQVSERISEAMGGVIDANSIKIALEAIAGAFTAFAACQALATLPSLISAVGTALTTLSLNPVGLVVAAVAGIVIVITQLWNTNEDFRNFITNCWEGIKNTAVSVWNGIKNAIVNPFNDAKDKVKSVIEAIKGFFNFKFKWPSIPMPHFSVTPSGWKIGDLLKGSIPSIGINWYAKAMDEPYMLSKATLFGAGEAGDEVVYGHKQLMNDIQNAVKGSKSSNENIIINVYATEKQNEKQIAEKVSELLSKQMLRGAF